MNPVFSSFLLRSSFLTFLLTALVLPVNAQEPKNRIFQWKFSNNQLSTELPTCGSFPITIAPFLSNGTSTGVPPYYMIGYALNGSAPRTTLIGTNVSNVSWTVDFPVGTTLALSVVDSEGTSGGIPPNLYKIVSGSTTNCVVNDDKRDFTLTSNSTSSTINTCDPWGLRIKGGVKPYNITFMQLNSPVVTNATLGQNDDAYTYRMRGDPGALMIAAVYDITGRFAFGAPQIMPQGSTDVNCPGLNSVSGSAADFDKQAEDARNAERDKDRRHRTAIIAGSVVAVVVVLLAAALIWWWFWYRPRRNKPAEIDLGADTSVKPYMETQPGQVLSINSFLTDQPSPGTPMKSPGYTNMSAHPGSTYTESDAPYDPYSQTHTDTAGTSQGRPSSAGSSRQDSTRRPGFSNFPVRRPNSKAAEAGYSNEGMSNGAGPSVNRNPSLQYAEPSDTRVTSVSTVNGESEVIIQHRDGGPGRVRELPPPYADRTSREVS
ncbi:hypothetical protein V5O48_008018 [Marasmius crinis-equi]|uniref:Uncharacterized protein n=1 Tax=Marasmius crinis-equi TaxID=585013 RepID=A0ABR3FFU3_9AGAR